MLGEKGIDIAASFRSHLPRQIGPAGIRQREGSVRLPLREVRGD